MSCNRKYLLYKNKLIYVAIDFFCFLNRIIFAITIVLLQDDYTQFTAKPRYNISDQTDQGNLDGKLIPSNISDVLAGCPVSPSRFHFVIPFQLVLTSARPKPDG